MGKKASFFVGQRVESRRQIQEQKTKGLERKQPGGIKGWSNYREEPRDLRVATR